MTYNFHIEPRDVLFMRDAKPMSASDAGLGANWPRPDQVWSAFINAFHRRWPAMQDWEHQHNRKPGDPETCSFRFGALKTGGLFPYATADGISHEGKTLFKQGLYLPCPLDLAAHKPDKDKANGKEQPTTLHPMQLAARGMSDLPAPLTHSISATVLGKEQPPQWIHASDYARYLAGEAFQIDHTPHLYDTERNTGIAIDPETGSTIDGKLYQAEYLRFHPEVRMAVQAECEIVGDCGTKADVFGKIAEEDNIPFIFGGQQGVALMRRQQQSLSLPRNQLAGSGLYLRWTLLTPALFPEITADAVKQIAAHPGGWLPNWVDASIGKVCLPRQVPERIKGESRDAWRARIAQSGRFAATLVAARIGKPVSFSGWDLQTGPKPTRLAVPAGSTYIFKCGDEDELQALAASLGWNGDNGDIIVNRRSTLFGEKGFGLGVCSRLTQNIN